jgi:hypothetical protein
MIDLGVVDYREEFHLKTFRRWFMIKNLSSNIKFRDGISLQKAALVDFLLCNPPLLQNILIHFGRAEATLNLEELLYQDNLEFGSAQNIDDFSKTCVFLISKKYLDFKRINGEILLLTDPNKPDFENTLSQRWKKEIELLQPILGKSINVLSNAILGRFNGY